MKKLTVLIIVIVIVTACKSPESTPRHVVAIDSLINRAIDENHIAGAVARVQKGDTVLHRKAYGYARKYNEKLEVIDQPEKMTPDHLFDLASLTKVCATTFGIMLLIDKGKINLDDPISEWLPEFTEGEKRKLTIRHLLTHSAGLYQWKPTYYYAENRNEQYKYIASLPLKWPVGEGRHYSDLGFMLLGEIIERVSGQPLEVFLEEKLFQPLDLQHTTFNPNKQGFKKIAATSHGNPFERRMVYDNSFGYTIDADPESWDDWRDYTLQGEVNDGNAWYAAGGVAGHAGLFATVDDLQKLVTLLLNKGSYKGKTLISPAVIDTFLTGNRYGNGLGWVMDPEILSAYGTPESRFGHTGFTGTSIVAVPEWELSIILLTNRQHVGLQKSGYYVDLDSLRQKILDVVLEKLNQ